MWTRPEGPRLTVTPGCLLLLAGLLYLDEGVGLLPWALFACLIHELGHMIAAKAMGGKIQRLSLSIVGAELAYAYPVPLSYGKESLVALAGPAANLLAGFLSFQFDAYLLAILSLGIGAFNLLPILPLDGGRVLYDLLADWLDPRWADRVLLITAGVLVGALVGLGVITAVKFANLTLLFTAGWLLLGTIRQGKGQ